MKNMKRIISAVLILALAVGSLSVLTACKSKKNAKSVSINGDKNVLISLGESITFSATTDPEGVELTWTVEENNLGGEYVLEGSRFTAKQVAGYAVIKVSTPNGLSDSVTVVINRDEPIVSQGPRVVFYAVDGKSIIDVRYADENGRVSVPDYSVSDTEICWLDADGEVVDPTALTITADTYFTAKVVVDSVYYTVRFLYYTVLEEDIVALVQVGDTYTIDYANGESISPETLAEITATIESATGMQVINWRCNINGYTIEWIAELV